LDLSSLGDTASLSDVVWQSAPDLGVARARVEAALADAQKTTLLPNPALDVAVGTIPIGPLNPPDLKDPRLDVPTLTLGSSVVLEGAKRGPRPRHRRGRQGASAARADDGCAGGVT